MGSDDKTEIDERLPHTIWHEAAVTRSGLVPTTPPLPPPIDIVWKPPVTEEPPTSESHYEVIRQTALRLDLPRAKCDRCPNNTGCEVTFPSTQRRPRGWMTRAEVHQAVHSNVRTVRWKVLRARVEGAVFSGVLAGMVLAGALAGWVMYLR